MRFWFLILSACLAVNLNKKINVHVYGINRSKIKFNSQAPLYEVIYLYFKIKNNQWIKEFDYIIDPSSISFLICEKIPEVNWFDGHKYTCLDVNAKQIAEEFVPMCPTIVSIRNHVNTHLINLLVSMYPEIQLVLILDPFTYILRTQYNRHLLFDKDYLLVNEHNNIKKLIKHTEKANIIQFTNNQVIILEEDCEITDAKIKDNL